MLMAMSLLDRGCRVVVDLPWERLERYDATCDEQTCTVCISSLSHLLWMITLSLCTFQEFSLYVIVWKDYYSLCYPLLTNWIFQYSLYVLSISHLAIAPLQI